jgi:hypothetical protein
MCNDFDETIIREGVQGYYAEWTGSEVKTVPYINKSSKKLVWINSDINDKINVPEILLPILRRFIDAHEKIIEERFQNIHFMKYFTRK